MNEINKEKNIKTELSERIPTTEDFKIYDSKSTYSESQKSSQKNNYLLKALQDFSNRYNLDTRNILIGKKFLITFSEIISLIKDVLEYQIKIIELDISEKEKIQEISQDYINNLSYTIFSFDKIDIKNNISKNNNNSKYNQTYRHQMLYNKKLNKTQPKFNLSHSVLTTYANNNNEEKSNKNNKSISKYFNSEIQKIKINKIEHENKKDNNRMKKEIKCFNPNNKSVTKYKSNIINTEINDEIPQNLKVRCRQNNNEIKNKKEEKKLIKKEDNKNKINKNNKKNNLKTKIYASNIKAHYKNQKKETDSAKEKFNSINSQMNFSLKNNSVILRSCSANIENKNIKDKKSNIFDAFKYYNSFNDLEKNLLDSQSVKEGYIIKGKINIFSNIPKPSILANKLLESSKKYINDYNGANEEERKRNNFNKYNHSHIHKKKK